MLAKQLGKDLPRGRVLRYRADVISLLTLAFAMGAQFAGYALRLPWYACVPILLLVRWGHLVQHNHAHLPLFHQPWLNEAIGWLMFLHGGLPLEMYREQHVRTHHVHLNGEGDWTSPFAYEGARRPDKPVSWLYYVLTYTVISGCIVLSRFLQRPNSRATRRFAVSCAVVLPLCAVMLYRDPPRFLLFYGLAWLATYVAVPINNWNHHVHCDFRDIYHSANVNLRPWCGRAAFNIGFHSAHHEHPGLHWSLLSEFHWRYLAPHTPREHYRTLRPGVLPRRVRNRAPGVAAVVLALLCLAAVPASAADAQEEPCPPTEAPSPMGPSGDTPELRPAFNWSPVPGATSYRLSIVDAQNQPVLQTELQDTFFLPEDELPTLVDLRWEVQAVNACGAGPSSGQVEFIVVPCPPKVAPVAQGPSGILNDPQPTFEWSAVPGATSYTLSVVDSEGNQVLRETDIWTTSFRPATGLPGQTDLHWKVEAVSACGAGPASEPVFIRFPCPLDAPVAEGPSGSIPDVRPTFSWSAVPGAGFYTLHVRNAEEETVLRRTQLGTTSFIPFADLPHGIDLQWKVKAENVCGPGLYSDSLFFRIENCQPEAPVAQSPSGSTLEVSPRFEWSAVPGADFYTLYVLDPDENPVLRETFLPENSFTLRNVALPVGVDLRWKVKVESPCGPGPYSESRPFRIERSQQLEAPVTQDPSGPITTTLRPTFSWSAVPGATAYSLSVLDPTGSPVLGARSVPQTSFTPESDLPAGVDLRWKVRAENAAGAGPDSAERVFTLRDSQPVTWMNLVNTSASGSSLTKTGPTGWNGGAISTKSLSGDGAVELIAGARGTHRAIGLGNGDAHAGHPDIEFAFILNDGGTLSVFEGGTHRGNFGVYTQGDRLRVAVESGRMRYFRNGQLLYESLSTPSFPLVVDTSLYETGASVSDVMLWGAWREPEAQPVTWTNLVSASASGTSLTKTGGTGWNGGASSTKRLNGDGAVEVRAGPLGTHRAIGLGTGDAHAGYADIEFAFILNDGGTLSVFEGGTHRGNFGVYAPGDRLRVATESGKVRYSRNGQLLYQSASVPSFPLVVDTSLYEMGASLSDVTLLGRWEP